MFGLLAAITLAGVAIGPAFGGLLIRQAHSLLAIFYVTTAVHAVFAVLVWCVIPESRDPEKMRGEREKWKRGPVVEEGDAVRRRGIGARLWAWAKRPFVFLSPLEIFWPVERKKGKGRDWNLTCIVLAQGLALSVLVRGAVLTMGNCGFADNSAIGRGHMGIKSSTRSKYLGGLRRR